MSLVDLVRARDKAKSQLDRDIGEAQGLARQARSLQDTAAREEKLTLTLEKACGALNKFAEEAHSAVLERTQTIVTTGLRQVFGDDLEFRMRQGTHGKLQKLDLLIVSHVDGVEVETEILSARGGGVAAVTGFLLRLVLILLNPSTPRIILLDETFAQLSEDFEPRLAQFLRDICDKADVQILMVTHSSAYTDYADEAYHISLDGDKARIRHLTEQPNQLVSPA